MNLHAVQIAFQALSSLAIAGGFLYTARQFINYRKAQHFANFSKLVELQMHLREMRVTDPSLAEVYNHDVADMTSEREIREHFFNLMQLSVFEIVWYGRQNGQIPEDYFRSWELRMREIAAERSFRAMMTASRMKILHEPFHTYMQEMLQSTDSPKAAPQPRPATS